MSMPCIRHHRAARLAATGLAVVLSACGGGGSGGTAGAADGTRAIASTATTATPVGAVSATDAATSVTAMQSVSAATAAAIEPATAAVAATTQTTSPAATASTTATVPATATAETSTGAAATAAATTTVTTATTTATASTSTATTPASSATVTAPATTTTTTTAGTSTTAAAASPSSTAAAAATPASPKVAVLDYSTLAAAAQRMRLARYHLAIIGIDTRTTSAVLPQVVAAIKAANPATQVAQYTIASAIRDDMAAQAAALTSSDWWLRNAAGQRVQSAPEYATYEVNMTDWAPANAAGQRWPQWKAAFDVQTIFKPAPQLDYVFTDNVMYQNVVADWKRIGSDQTVADTVGQLATRRGFASYWDTLRSLIPSLKLMGNVHTDLLASTEIKGKLEGAFLEGMIGKSYSYETWGGWAKMMAVYRAAMANTASPKTVVFQVYIPTATDYAAVRYGIASALLDDGYFAANTDNLSEALPWYDEFSAPLGAAVDVPPMTATTSGVFLRRYANGVVLVNPTATSATIDVGAGYKRLSGSLDTVINNGAAERMVTLGPKQGLVLLKQ